MNSFEFEITIQSKSGKNSWPVVIRCKQPDGLTIHAKGILILNPNDFAKLIENSENEKEYGILLGKALFREEVRDTFIRAFSKSSQDNPLRILLAIEAAQEEQVKTLHWERLCAPIDADGGWNLLARDCRVPFSLYIPTIIDRRFPPIGRRDLRALILVASPSNLGKYQLAPFDVEAALSGVKEALGEIPYEFLANNVEGALGPPTLQELSKQLTNAPKPYTLLHFVCHGKLIDTGETVLYWATPDDQVLPIAAKGLLEELRYVGNQKGLPHFTFLCTCESADPRAEEALGGLAQRLVRDLGMPAVVAMTRKVSVKTALAIGQSFYRRLRESGEVDVALQEATAGLGDRHDITVPALFSRLGGRPLFSDRLENRELTDEEIEYGIDKLRELLQERSPHASVLQQRFKTQVETLKKTRGAESSTAREDKKQALIELNNLCEQVLDLSFDALAALGKEPPTYKAECPFPGLSSFSDNKYHKFFFGRDELVKELQKQLERNIFLAVIGASGSGKSSVVLAGLITQLKKQESNLQWTYMTPGREPVKQLERRLEKLSKLAEQDSVLVVDQFEEVFTLCESETERKEFIEKLLNFAEQHRVVITMRADFLGECTLYPELREKIETRQKLVGPMQPSELITAMKMQADSAGLRFEAGLSNSILNEVQGEPGAMPLLQYALQELWKRRHGRWLCCEEYEAIGGVKRAIAKTANDFYKNLPIVEQEQVKNIFLRLTCLDENAVQGESRRDTRRRVELEDLMPTSDELATTKKLVQKLAGEGVRLVVTGRNEATGKEEVEVTHEALIRHWPMLQKWLNESQSELQLRETINKAAVDWQKHKDAPDKNTYLIHQGGRLEDSELLLKQPKYVHLNQLEAEYVTACIELRDRRIREEKERTRRQLAIASMTSVVFAGFAIFAGYQWRQAAVHETQALSQSSEALLLAGQQLNAFLKIAQAEQMLKQPFLQIFKPDNKLQTQVQDTLKHVVDELKESNQLEDMEDKGSVSSVIYSPNNKYIATTTFDGTAKLKLWDLAGRLLKKFNVSQGEVSSATFSPDSKLVATTGADGTVKLWDLDGKQAGRFHAHQAEVSSVAFSPDGKYLATASYDKTAKLWDLKTGKQQGKFIRHTDRITSVSFSPDSKLVATASADGTVKMWYLNGQEARKFTGHQGEVSSVSFSPNGKYLATAGVDNTAKLWDLKTGKQQGEFIGHQAKLSNVSFSPDTKYLVTSSADGTAKLWDLSGKQLVEFKGHQGPVFSVSFSPDGQQLATASGNDTVRLWNLTEFLYPTDWQVIEFQGHQGEVYTISFSPDGKYLATAGIDRTVRLWDLKGKQQPKFKDKGHTDRVVSVSFSPDGKYLATSSFDGTAKLWDLKTGEQQPQFIRYQKPVSSVSFCPDRKLKLLLTSSLDGTAILWDFNSQKKRKFEHETPILTTSFSQDCKYIATADDQNLVKLWDLSGKQPREFKAHNGAVSSVSFSPDGKYIATASFNDNTAKLWDFNGKPVTEFKGHKSGVIRINFSSDSKYIATASADSTARLWELTGQPSQLVRVKVVREFKGHKGPVTGVSFSPDGTKLATAGHDGTARLWPIQEEAMVRGCKWVHDYLNNSPTLTREERHVCDGIDTSSNQQSQKNR